MVIRNPFNLGFLHKFLLFTDTFIPCNVFDCVFLQDSRHLVNKGCRWEVLVGELPPRDAGPESIRPGGPVRGMHVEFLLHPAGFCFVIHRF